jgi:hypothetical protein
MCCGYSVRVFWFQKGSQAKSSTPVEPMGVGATTSAEDGSSTASGQAVCDLLNGRWRPV